MEKVCLEWVHSGYRRFGVGQLMLGALKKEIFGKGKYYKGNCSSKSVGSLFPELLYSALLAGL